MGYVITAHNLVPHYGPDGWGVKRNMRQSYRLADAVICHSKIAADVVASAYQVTPDHIHVVPHGDFSCTLPPPISRAKARAKLDIRSDEKIILMFGAQAPYKGMEEVVEYWRTIALGGFTLCLAGAPHCDAYGHELSRLIGDAPGIRWENCYLDEVELACWLDACDAVLFNYRAILTSGAACLARSRGCPILIPRRLNTIDLGSPSSGILRFNAIGDKEFLSALDSLPSREAIGDETTAYRTECSWDRVGRLTREVYANLVP
jgi:glycosyltransferase involved in cell wall biosynthesis